MKPALQWMLIAAQAAPEPAEGAFNSLLQYGALGAICVLLILALIYTARGWLKEKDGRLSDQKLMGDAREKDNDALTKLTIEMKEFAAQQQIEAIRSQDATQNALTSQKEELGEVKTAVTGLQQEQVRLGAAISNLTQQRGS